MEQTNGDKLHYTKGEWGIVLVGVHEIGGEIQHYFITGEINGKSGRTIADVGCWRDRDNAPEDAHLIAASPDLYEACKVQHNAIDILFAMLIERDRDFLPSKSGLPWDAIIRGSQALAKAEGRNE